jgi:hypothetical protein
MRLLLLSVCAGLFAFTPPIAAQSIAGEWEATLHTPGGIRTVKMIFEVHGDTVTGTVKRPTGDVHLTGTVKVNAVKFSYTIDYNGNPLVLTVTATVTGDSMQGMVDFGGVAEDEFSAKRSGSGG